MKNLTNKEFLVALLTVFVLLLISGCSTNLLITYDTEMNYGEGYTYESKLDDCTTKFIDCDRLHREYPKRYEYCCIFDDESISIRSVKYGKKPT